MAFIKTGNGEITGVIKTEDLTEEQKKSVKNKAKKVEGELILETEKKGEAN